ncbi:MAG: hypothetical protein ACFFDW_01590 [Candidatus Thorarchaeota archaeon]
MKENKKTLSIVLLSIITIMIGFQVMIGSSEIAQAINANNGDQNFRDLQFKPSFDTYSVNQVNFSEGIDSYWFYINIGIIVLTPLGFILPVLLIKDKKKEEEVAAKPDPDASIEPQTAMNTDAAASISSGNIIGRIGIFILFLENIVVLLVYILFFVLIPTYSENLTPIDILHIYTILFNIDFLAAILISIGMILLSLKAEKSKVYAYLATGSWVVFIGTNIYPRIRLTNIFTGDITTGEQFIDMVEKIAEYLTSFYGRDLLLQTIAFCFFALAIFYSAKFLHDNGQLRSKGIVNGFGITNYVAGGLINVILLLLLTFGFQMEPSAVSTVLILLAIVYVIKLLAVPLLGLIASIVTFSQMNPKKNKS